MSQTMNQQEWTNEEIMARVDHTLLKADASWDAISVLCREAIQYGAATVCVPPTYVSSIRKAFGSDLAISVVIGFPLGYQSPFIKSMETLFAKEAGIDEVDMVINLGNVKNGDFDLVTKEIAIVRESCRDEILKVIIETCYLTEEEKIALCHCVTEGGADYIKTSTGFGSAGASLQDIPLLRQHIGKEVKIKAAGGIRSREDIVAFLNAGCDRIGASAAVTALYGDHAG